MLEDETLEDALETVEKADDINIMAEQVHQHSFCPAKYTHNVGHFNHNVKLHSDLAHQTPFQFVGVGVKGACKYCISTLGVGGGLKEM